MNNKTENSPRRPMVGQLGKMLLAAAMTMPAMQVARADSAPEKAMVGYKFLDYQDWQGGQSRIAVHAPAFAFQLPFAETWSVEGTVVNDTVSGASPRYHTSRFVGMQDKRAGKNLSISRYFGRGSLTFGVAYSSETDYRSRAYSLSGNISSEDKNTTLNLGIGVSNDEIYPSSGIMMGEHLRKNGNEMMIGVTQVLTQTDIVQANVTYGKGRGYFSDPYKFLDERPERKNQLATLLRWNHHFRETDGTTHLSYRWYKDDYGIRSHTISGEYVQPFGNGWSVTPLLRIYSQNAADFYSDALKDPTVWPVPADWTPGVPLSFDQRLAAYGARSFGFKLSKRIDHDWLFDFKYENYEQRSSWAFGHGSPNLEPLKARILQIGMSYYF